MTTPRVITVIGSLNTDLVTITPRIPSGGETITASSFSTGSGGKGANQAVAAARLSRSQADLSSSNVSVKMIGAVGADEFGPNLISSLSASGVDTSGVKIVEGYNTGVAVILVEEKNGENRILLSPGANHSLQPPFFLTPDSIGLPDLLIIQLEIPLPTILQIIDVAQKAGVDVLLNPAPAVPLPDRVFCGLAHLVLNESEAAILTGQPVSDIEQDGADWEKVAKQFVDKGVRNVIITLGSKGAYVYEKVGGGFFVPAGQVKTVVDTTAAGDTFVGAFAVGIVRGEGNIRDHAMWACKAAARTVERKGAQIAIPWENEI